VGIGTVVYAFGIGPLVQLILKFMPTRVLAEFGAAAPMTTMIECPNPTQTQTGPSTQTC
ncbi:MAG: rane protein, partial [Mycobacterium sp.]|nr:rane protein [Mycobacterium sp.]